MDKETNLNSKKFFTDEEISNMGSGFKRYLKEIALYYRSIYESTDDKTKEEIKLCLKSIDQPIDGLL
jgi:hypothetical protein